MKRFALSFIIVICFFYSISAQENTEPRSKIFNTWISVYDQPYNTKGVLYEIRDSSILVSDSQFKTDYLSGNFNVVNIDFNNIDHLSVRRKNSILTGTIVGSVIGLSSAVGLVQSAGIDNEWKGTMMFVYGSLTTGFGAGIGALVGSFRIHIPINGSFENFKRSESRLERYSYVHEYDYGLNIYEKEYEHKWFIGLLMGPSLPSGDFEASSTDNLNSDLSKVGGNSSVIIGYNFLENYGISASFLNSSYSFKDSSIDQWWSLSSIMAGPVYSVSIGNSFFLDLKPMIGYTNSYLYVDDNTEKSGNGFSIYPGSLLRYNFSLRWSAMIETGYLISNQKFKDGISKIQTINLGFGIAYRFK